MQTPRKSLSGNGPSEVPRRTSPGTSRSSRQSIGAGAESDSATPSRNKVKTPSNGSPGVSDRRSPRSPASERKRPSKLNELETQITRLQEELKKTQEQLASSELQKKQAEQEVEDVNKQFAALTTKLEETQLQLKELSEEECARIQELQKISEQRDKVWKSELEATQKQHVVDSAALLSATNEIQTLKLQLEMAINSKSASETKEAAIIDTELLAQEKDNAETLSLIENLKSQLMKSTKFNEDHQQLVTDTQVQLEVANATIETLRSDGLKAIESYNLLMAELAESKAQISSLEETVRKLKEDGQFENNDNRTSLDAEIPREQFDSFSLEVEQLKSALESAETRFLEEQIKYTMQMQSAYEAAESMRMECNLRESKLESSLQETKHEASVMKENLIANEAELRVISCQNEKMNVELNTLRRNPETKSEKTRDVVTADVAELKRKLMDKETELGTLSYQNEKLNDELKTLRKNLETESEKLGDMVTADVAELKRKLMDKETELQNVIEESEVLKMEMEKKEAERSTSVEVAKAELEIARSAEQEALVRVGMVTEESDKTSRNLARTKEQLEATQVANSDMVTELKRLRVQTEQWRKAAEAAAAILTTGNNGKVMERSGSLDSGYNSIAGKLLSSPFSDDLDESSPKKKNGNVLKKIGGFLKKGQK